MVPLGTLVKVREAYGPDGRCVTMDIPPPKSTRTCPRVQLGQAEALMSKLIGDNLPKAWPPNGPN